MWKGRTNAETSKFADEFNSSIKIDKRMYKEDIEGSIAHVAMLSRCNIISKSEAKTISDELKKILNEIENKKLKIDENAEDIHMFVEEVLTKRIGSVGKKLHTARSRNDQVALDIGLKGFIGQFKNIFTIDDSHVNDMNKRRYREKRAFYGKFKYFKEYDKDDN